jgi:hypothetical protein
MLKGIWIYSILKHSTFIWLETNEVPYDIWEKEGEVEVRIDVDKLSLNDIYKIRNEFGISDDIKVTDYDYLILYY